MHRGNSFGCLYLRIYCHSVRDATHDAPTGPRRGLFATSSAIPGIVEGVHCATVIPVCASRHYPLSDALEMHTCTRDVHPPLVPVPASLPFSPCLSLRLPFYQRPTYADAHIHARVHTCTACIREDKRNAHTFASPPLLFRSPLPLLLSLFLFRLSTSRKNFPAQTPQRRISSSH